MINSELLFKLYKLKRKYRLDDGDFKESDHMRAPKGAKDKDGNAIGGRWVEKSQIANLKELGIENNESDVDETISESASSLLLRTGRGVFDLSDFDIKKDAYMLYGIYGDKLTCSINVQDMMLNLYKLSNGIPTVIDESDRMTNMLNQLFTNRFERFKKTSENYMQIEDDEFTEKIKEILNNDFISYEDIEELQELCEEHEFKSEYVKYDVEEFIDEMLQCAPIFEALQQRKKDGEDTGEDILQRVLIEEALQQRKKDSEEIAKDTKHRETFLEDANSKTHNIEIQKMDIDEFSYYADRASIVFSEKLGFSAGTTEKFKKYLMEQYEENPEMMSLYGNAFKCINSPLTYDEYSKRYGKTYEVRTFYSEKDKEVVFSRGNFLEGDIKMIENFFHEYGHVIDDLLYVEKGFDVRNSIRSNADFMSDCRNLANIAGVTLDVPKDAEYMGTEYLSKSGSGDIFSEDSIKGIQDSVVTGILDRLQDISKSNPKFEQSEEFVSNIISDILSAVTCGKLKLDYEHSSSYYMRYYDKLSEQSEKTGGNLKLAKILFNASPQKHKSDSQSSELFSNYLNLKRQPCFKEVYDMLMDYIPSTMKSLEKTYTETMTL